METKATNTTKKKRPAATTRTALSANTVRASRQPTRPTTKERVRQTAERRPPAATSCKAGAPGKRAQQTIWPDREQPSTLSAFVRDVGRFEVLDAAGEQRLAREIESWELELWQRALSFAPVVERAVETLQSDALDVFGKSGQDHAHDTATAELTATAEDDAANAAGARSARPDGELAAALRDLIAAAAPVRGANNAESPDRDRRERTKDKADLEIDTDRLAGAARHAATRIRTLRGRERPVMERLMALFERIERGEEPLPRGTTRLAFIAFLTGVRQAAEAAARARTAFVQANLRLVFMVARKYTRFGVPLADLVQEGNIGLMTAVDRFDYRRGLRFSTYAIWWIRHMIGRAVSNRSRMVRVPVYLLESQQRLDRVRQELTGQLGRTPTDDELVEASGYKSERLHAVRSMVGTGQSLSLDQGVGEDQDQQRIEIFQDPHADEASPEQTTALRESVAQLTFAFDKLTPQEVDILRKRFGLEDGHEWTLSEIGEGYGVTRERIRQVQNRALLKLREELAAR